MVESRHEVIHLAARPPKSLTANQTLLVLFVNGETTRVAFLVTIHHQFDVDVGVEDRAVGVTKVTRRVMVTENVSLAEADQIAAK